MSDCRHEFLTRHEYKGEVWFQCSNGCDFVVRPAAAAAMREIVAERVWKQCGDAGHYIGVKAICLSCIEQAIAATLEQAAQLVEKDWADRLGGFEAQQCAIAIRSLAKRGGTK